MTEFYSLDESIEPPRKKMKCEPLLIQFDVGKLDDNGDVHILLEKYETNVYTEDFKPVLHFQTVEGADYYMIANMIPNSIYIDINKGYTVDEIYKYFITGNFMIGTINYYYFTIHKYYKFIIKNLNNLDHDDNSEIKLHYTTNRSNPLNVAWRTINWDLFSDYVIQ
jgi:hypothetical protein